MTLSQLTITSSKSMKSTFLTCRCALNKIKTLNPHIPANSSFSIQLNELQQTVKSKKSTANKKCELCRQQDN